MFNQMVTIRTAVAIGFATVFLPLQPIQVSAGDGIIPQVATCPATSPDGSRSKPEDSIRNSDRMLNLVFARDPGVGNYDGAAGSPSDYWNMASVGTTAIDFMRYSDASPSTARMRISRHDGAWGIKGQHGVFHAYIYHNCRCVDLEVDLLDLPAGRFRAYVYAHGDAPDQNACIELKLGNQSIAKKATANDGSWRFREAPLVEGVQYVTFDFDVTPGVDVHFISHRDGSDYSMFNAIQLVPIESARRAQGSPQSH